MVFRLTLSTLRWRSPRQALAIGIDLDRVHGDTEAACLAFGYAIRSGHPDLAPAGLWWSAACLRDRGDHARAVEFFRRAIESDHANWTPRAASDLAELLEGQGDVAGARVHYQRAIDFRRDGTDPMWARLAAVKLEVMLTEHGAIESARAVHERATGQARLHERTSFAFDRAREWERRGNVVSAIDSLHEVIAEDARRAPEAAFQLERLLRVQSDLDVARAASRIAADSDDDRAGSTGFTAEVERRLFQERVIVLRGEVDDVEANRIVAQLLLLEQADPTADIHFYLNSPGGLVSAGMAILDTMRLVRPDVVTWAVGLAAGIAQVLLSEGAPGKRYALPHARIMMRKPSGPPDPTPAQLDLLDRTTREVAVVVAAQTGRPVEQVAVDSEAGRWFSAGEALDYGLIDGIRDRLGHAPR